MKQIQVYIVLIACCMLLVACNNQQKLVRDSIENLQQDRFRVGMMVPDSGLGDHSFNDLAMEGLIKARDELDILFDYRDLTMVRSIEQGLIELVESEADLIIGIGYSIQADLEKVAQQFPEKQFLLIDSNSEIENIDSIIFNEYEGSYLAGVVAASITETGVVGFVGGAVDPIIENFLRGFKEGAQSIQPNIEVIVQYSHTYSDIQTGMRLANRIIAQNADVLYASAGYTGVGVLKAAQNHQLYAIGVDNDQYLYGERAVVTSMMKNIDVAIYNYIKNKLDGNVVQKQMIEYGIANDGISLAPIRIIEEPEKLESEIRKIKQTLIHKGAQNE